MTDLTVLATDRQEGKTTRLLEWLGGGQAISSYPGWSRVLVVHNFHEVERLRSEIRATEPASLEDDPHRIYSWEEWQTAQGVDPSVEVAVDNAEFHLPRLPGRVTLVSLTAKRWESP